MNLKNTPSLVLVAVTVLVAGCGWVDGTGQQTNALPSIEVLFDDGSPFTTASLMESEAILVTSTASDRDGVITTWRWSDAPIAQGLVELCEGNTGFDTDLAADSLAAACEVEGCEVTFEQREVLGLDGETVTVSGSLDSAETSTVQFIATMPKLKSPVALVYSLSATDNLGGTTASEHTFCVNSVNEPPIAVDDVFTMLESEVLQPSASDRNLLRNDSDDEDIRNKPLQVLVNPVSAPLAASDFELFSDGSFRYAFAGSPLLNDVEDRFDYEISDGTFTVSATATIKIVAVDDPPVLVEAFPPLAGIVGIAVSDDFNQNVADPEGAILTFTVQAASLPPSGEINLTQEGVLIGTPTAQDIGSYELQVIASDGSESLSFTVPFSVIANAPVEARTIPDQVGIVGTRFNLLTGVFFTDPESQRIQYDVEATSAAVDLTISDGTGLITGFVREAGIFDITVIASDGVSVPTRSTFVLEVAPDNVAPVFNGPNVGSQTVRFNTPIAVIRSNFSDPDGDQLTYTMVGDLPPGVNLSPLGVITGRPTRRGNYLALRIQATDPDGLFARTNAFSLFVR